MTAPTLRVFPVEAFVYSSMWVVDCGDPWCKNCQQVPLGELQAVCINCNAILVVTWPEDMVRISEVLWRRPVPQTRNWAPPGHRQSQQVGIPDGQSVEDLVAENERYGVV